MIFRARVVASHGPNLKDVTIPARYGSAVVPRIRSGVDAQPEETVLVARLSTNPRLNDWQIIGWEDEVGRTWDPSTHDHPISQVVGLSDALADKADVTALATKADLPPAWTAPDTVSASFSPTVTGSGLVYRMTAFGLQLRGRLTLGSLVAMDSVVATFPTSVAPPWEIHFQVSHMDTGTNGYAAHSRQAALRTDGSLTTRQDWPAGTYTFTATLTM